MTEESLTERGLKRSINRYAESQFALGFHLARESGMRVAFDQQRVLLIRMASRRFGDEIGYRLDYRLNSIHDQGTLNQVADLIVDNYTGGQLIAGVEDASENSG